MMELDLYYYLMTSYYMIYYSVAMLWSNPFLFKMGLLCLLWQTNDCIFIHETVMNTFLLFISYATSNQAQTPQRDSGSLLQ